MTQDPNQLPDYRPAAAGGPGQIPGTGQYANPTPASPSTIALTIVSGVLTISGICCIVGIVPLILGVVAMTQNSSDPAQAAKLTRIGWIVLVLLSVLFVLAIIGAVIGVMYGASAGVSL